MKILLHGKMYIKLASMALIYISNFKLKLTQKQAAIIFGGGVNAFNRYEKGKLPIPRPLSLLLTVLRNHPNQLKEEIFAHCQFGLDMRDAVKPNHRNSGRCNTLIT